MCVEYCEWLRPQGGTAGSGSLAHNEGDVPHLLPVSDASLNQDLREVKKRWRRGAGKKKSQLLSRLPCGRLAVLAVRRFFDICSSQPSARLVFIASAAGTGFPPSGDASNRLPCLPPVGSLPPRQSSSRGINARIRI